MITTHTVTPAEGRDAQPATPLARKAGTALQVGGLCWMGMYGLEVVVGLASGKSVGPAHSRRSPGSTMRRSRGGHPRRPRPARALHPAAGSRAGLRDRGRGSGDYRGDGESALALTDALGRAAPASAFGFPELLSVLLSATLMAVAAKRARALPRRASTILLLAGALTFPLAVATVPIGHIIPDWILDNLPLALGGGAFTAVGAALRRGGRGGAAGWA